MLVFKEPVRLVFHPALDDSAPKAQYGYVITGEYGSILFQDTLWFSQRDGAWMIEEVLFKPFIDWIAHGY
jgi:hypothetical protein